MHKFQGRTVDNVIAAIETQHPHLKTQRSFYVEISRARDRVELVTNDAAELRAQLQAVTGERIAALEGIGEAPGKGAEFAQAGAGKERDGGGMEPKDREMPVQERERAVGMDLGL